MIKFSHVTVPVTFALVMSLYSNIARASVDDETVRDLHCLIVYMGAGSSKQANIQVASLMGTTYFLGKLDGRTPKMDLETEILSELPAMQGLAFQAEATRCEKELRSRGADERAMGKDLQQRAAQRSLRENSR